MGSLQEQLLKAGLVDKNRANKAKKDKQKQSKVARNAGVKTQSRAKTAAQKEQAKRVERDRALNQKKLKQAEQKAVFAQIKQLIEINKLDRRQGEVAYGFIYKNKVMKIIVTDEIKQHLSQGRLAIVRLVLKSERLFEVVPAVIAEKIAQRDAGRVLFKAEKSVISDEDDPYAQFKIPDDLMW